MIAVSMLWGGTVHAGKPLILMVQDLGKGSVNHRNSMFQAVGLFCEKSEQVAKHVTATPDPMP